MIQLPSHDASVLQVTYFLPYTFDNILSFFQLLSMIITVRLKREDCYD